MRLFDLSLRYKMPLWGGGLILATALALSASFALKAWDDLKHDLLANAEDLGRSMSRTLFRLMLTDDVWAAFETVSEPFSEPASTELAESLLVLDNKKRIYVSSQPESYPVLSDLSSLGEDFRALTRMMPDETGARNFVFDESRFERIFVAVPIAVDGARLGTLVIAYNKSLLWDRFKNLTGRSIWITLLILCILLPINFYWGRRMMEPMRLIAERIAQIGRGELLPLKAGLYPHGDEVGLIYRAYDNMMIELKEKAALEKEIMQSERMATVGRLSAGIAHEINNPLGGMLNAISTLKRHGDPDPRTQKTMLLIERGLQQISETVAALLVEAKVKSRPLTPHDLDDVRVLITPESAKHRTEITWDIELPESLSVPSTLIRQVLINLGLNAIQAAGADGKVGVAAHVDAVALILSVENNGKSLSPEQRVHLFEPFTRFSERGNGLGLWICYQIVTQLGGVIHADSSEGRTKFVARIPLETTHESNPAPHLPH